MCSYQIEIVLEEYAFKTQNKEKSEASLNPKYVLN